MLFSFLFLGGTVILAADFLRIQLAEYYLGSNSSAHGILLPVLGSSTVQSLLLVRRHPVQF